MPQFAASKHVVTSPPVERPANTLAWIEARAGHAAALRAAASGVLLQNLRLDGDCVIAAQLTVLPSDAETETAVLEAFGPEITNLFSGVHRMATMQGLSKPSLAPTTHALAAERAQQTESLRKMLLAMVDDVRVVLIKLVERLVSLRSAALSAEARRNDSAQAEARDVMEVFAPPGQSPRSVANQMGA